MRIGILSILVACSLLAMNASAQTDLNETVLSLAFDTGNAAPYSLPSTIVALQGWSMAQL